MLVVIQLTIATFAKTDNTDNTDNTDTFTAVLTNESDPLVSTLSFVATDQLNRNKSRV